MATTSDWNFFQKNVQSGLTEGRYMNAAFTMIAAGPPRLEALGTETLDLASGTDVAYPIGVVQNFNMGQSSQIMRLFEIGSERSYFMRGRTMGTIGLGRIMYHGPSLLRVLYAYSSGEYANKETFSSLYLNNYNANLNTSGLANSKKEYGMPAGANDGNIWIDLASDVFSQPIGLMIYMKDSNNDTVGAFYFENCQITNHGFAADSGGTADSGALQRLLQSRGFSDFFLSFFFCAGTDDNLTPPGI